MSKQEVTLDDLRAGISLATGASHQLVLKRIPADFLELNLGFDFDSAVLLPTLQVGVSSADATKRKVSPFVVLRKIFVYAEQNAGKKLMVIGHTDTAGAEGVNSKLSAMRARSIYALLKGDRNGWAEGCNSQHETTDVQTIVRWASREHGFACDPGPIDGIVGRQTRTALERFRRRYNDEFAGHLPLTGKPSIDDWKAFYDLYEVSLARFLSVPDGQLASKRAKLSFCGESTLACGEAWPVASVGVDGLRSATNRRVDVVFFDEECFPSLQTQEPPGFDLYGTHLRFRRSVIKLKNDVIDVRCISTDGLPIPEAHYELTLSDGATRTGRLDRTGGSIEVDVAPGVCTVSYPDPDDVRAKALAARMRAALTEPLAWRAIYAVLAESPKTLEQVEAAYSRYFDTLGRQGMAQDLTKASDNALHRMPINHLMAYANVGALKPSTEPQVIAWVAHDFCDDAQAGSTGVGSGDVGGGGGQETGIA